MSEDAVQVLLVTDDSLLAEVTRFRLELLGSTVITVSSAEQAEGHLQDELPALIVVDQALPQESGIEFIGRIKGTSRTAGVPVLMLSRRADLHDVQAAFDVGVDDYLVTPFDPLVLERKVEALVPDFGQVSNLS